MSFVMLPAVGLFTLAALAVIIWLAKRAIRVVPPDAALVITGTPRARRDDPMIVRGGRYLQKPLIELVDTLDLRPLEVQVRVPGEHAEISGHLTAVVKIAGTAPGIGRAARRLLGLPRAELARLAERVLQHHLTCLLLGLSPLKVLEDPIAFREKLIEEAEPELNRLGLEIDTVSGELRG